ncbi:MAG TPA: hypothetical protein VEI50_12025 [Nitrospiraceae bacterium]|nr:hypothetical protein [Nitrospiraceae bacterium]
MKSNLVTDTRSLLMDRAVASLGDRRFGILLVIALTMFGWFESSGCTSAPKELPMPSPTQKALIGKSRQELMACAAVQPQESLVGDLTVLRYYKEASILEESFVASKSSVARIHHGYWATLGLKNDHVEGVQYDSVPSSYKDDDHCDEIFENCLGK